MVGELGWRDRTHRSYSGRLVPLLPALLFVLGCASARPITADGPIELKGNQGILVVHVDSDFPIRRLRFDFQADAATDLAAGQYVALLVVPAGNYRWTTIEVPTDTGDTYYQFRMRRNADWSFKVEAGRINYPGEIIVRGSRRDLLRERRIYAWTANRPALALDRLRASYSAVLNQHPLANGRSERDDFLARYQALAPFGSPKISEASPE